ncbi:hypothetical protein [Vibrio sp. WXL103]|uniref:hypothetical protein n=1 Tax=Vibrio sp. WXL103 TaxID=3450710 RepID=UPI003EC613D0
MKNIVKLRLVSVVFCSLSLLGCNDTGLVYTPPTLDELTLNAPYLRACLLEGEVSLALSSEEFKELSCTEQPVELHVVSQISGLESLSLVNMPLNDVSNLQHEGLSSLTLKDTGLSQLDIAPVPNLRVLDLNSNQLTQLDLRPAKQLDRVSVNGNNLSTLWLDDDEHHGLRISGLTGQPIMEEDLLFYDDPAVIR